MFQNKNSALFRLADRRDSIGGRVSDSILSHPRLVDLFSLSLLPLRPLQPIRINFPPRGDALRCTFFSNVSVEKQCLFAFRARSVLQKRGNRRDTPVPTESYQRKNANGAGRKSTARIITIAIAKRKYDWGGCLFARCSFHACCAIMRAIHARCAICLIRFNCFIIIIVHIHILLCIFVGFFSVLLFYFLCVVCLFSTL